MENRVNNRMKINLLEYINLMFNFYTVVLQEGFTIRITITLIL